MKTIADINQLYLPVQYKEAISYMIYRLKDFPVIKDVILFGSCARQGVSTHSDIDLALVVSEPISPEEEWDIDNYIRNWEADIPCDIVFIPAAAFEREIKGETIIRPIMREGVQLSGLLHQCKRAT